MKSGALLFRDLFEAVLEFNAGFSSSVLAQNKAMEQCIANTFTMIWLIYSLHPTPKPIPPRIPQKLLKRKGPIAAKNRLFDFGIKAFSSNFCLDKISSCRFIRLHKSSKFFNVSFSCGLLQL